MRDMGRQPRNRRVVPVGHERRDDGRFDGVDAQVCCADCVGYSACQHGLPRTREPGEHHQKRHLRTLPGRDRRRPRPQGRHRHPQGCEWERAGTTARLRQARNRAVKRTCTQINLIRARTLSSSARPAPPIHQHPVGGWTPSQSKTADRTPRYSQTIFSWPVPSACPRRRGEPGVPWGRSGAAVYLARPIRLCTAGGHIRQR